MLPNHKFCQVNFGKLLEMLMMHYSPSVSPSPSPSLSLASLHCKSLQQGEERKGTQHHEKIELSKALLIISDR